MSTSSSSRTRPVRTVRRSPRETIDPRADVRFIPRRFFSAQVGMRHFHKLKNHYHCPIINLDKLWTLVGEEKRVECAKDKSKAPVIDLTDHGIFKLLGKGQLPEQPVVVKCRYISKLAEKKIKEVGGAAILTA
mmetsp:Transcript_14116/g.57356  ORF Transcript_14116/g.57356 Transcript_14116/m.57356 type:complete len:133 (+) Transcript_14116:466-864(+)